MPSRARLAVHVDSETGIGLNVIRTWLLTWTTYGTWLPGDDRGFVSNVDLGDGRSQRLNQVGYEPAAKHRGLQLKAQENMSGAPVYLKPNLATALLEQFKETASHRGWQLLAVAIMPIMSIFW